MMTNNTMEKVKFLGLLNQTIDQKKLTDEWESVKYQAIAQNPWFTSESIEKSLRNIQDTLLNGEKLHSFVSKYSNPSTIKPKRIGLVLAGNIPIVGIHDIIMVYISGHKAVVKYSEKDMVLIPWMLRLLFEIDENSGIWFESTERLTDIDAVIATGSDNSARYFEAYFRKYPNIIRKSRSSVAILSKLTTEEEMRSLMGDILDYFGLGCRNISKLYLEKGFDLQRFLNISEEYKDVNNHNKYRNNYDYNLSLFLLNKQKFLQSATFLMLEDEKPASRIATLHYEWFDEWNSVSEKLFELKDSIQCVVSNMQIPSLNTFPPGNAQCPAIDDFADNVDTFAFLLKI
jgi:hypothetical protein